MSNDSEHNYRVFISYAHADAQTAVGKELIASFKEQINAALQSAAGEDLVFLDSEALEWGDEWSSKIMECLQQCKVFVCLLSPNYQESSYCKRERLMWERREIRLGRLRKGTHPVYYIRIDDEKTEELLISQADDSKPFFENIEQIREDIIAEKIERVKKIAEKVKNKELAEEQASSVRYGFLHISPNFVGRLGELNELCEICSQNHIPIITGGAGVGKSELAVAYASGYAERYPQGRFMLHMEGVEDWNHAVVKLVEDNSSAAKSLKDLLELPEDYDKLPLEEKRRKAVQSLWKRSSDGRLLLILDNLDKLSLVSDNGLNKLLDGVGDLPENVDIIATSRNNNLRRAGHVKALSGIATDYNGLPVLYEIDNLDTASAFELFCRINNDQFPFAKCNPECMNDDVRREYGALMEIISYLKGHAWSLEIIAALLAENTDDKYTFQCKLEEIKQTTTGIAGDDSSSNLSPALTPEQLLQPTFDRIAVMDHGCKIGVKILELATVAAFFPPDMVSDEALLGYWKKYYTEFEKVGFDAGAFAIKQLHALHLINGDGCVSKMHRLTRDVLLERQPEEDKLAIVKKMQAYWDDYHAENPNITLQQVQPWTEWALEWSGHMSELQINIDFLNCLGNIAHESKNNNLYYEAERLHSFIVKNARVIKNKSLIATALGSLASIHDDLNRIDEAECEYNESLSNYRELPKSSYYESSIALTLNNLATLHDSLNLFEKAEHEYNEALSIRRKLAVSTHGLGDADVAETLNNLAILHDKNNKTELAEHEYIEALDIYRRLNVIKPNIFDNKIVGILNNLAILHEKNNYPDDAEHEFIEALLIVRRLSKSSPGHYESTIADILNNLGHLHKNINKVTDAELEYKEALSIIHHLEQAIPDLYLAKKAGFLNNLASLHGELNRLAEAEQEFCEALSIQRKLAKLNPDRYNFELADTLNNFADLHMRTGQIENAERKYSEAIKIYFRLASINPERCDSYVAMTMSNLAILHEKLKHYEAAEHEFNEALTIRQRLAASNPERYNSYVADTLYNLASFHFNLNRYDEAEQEYGKALDIYHSLIEINPDRFKFGMAKTLNNLGILHVRLNRLEIAEREYSESLKLYSYLANINPVHYDCYVAMTLYNLAIFHEQQNKLKVAESEYLKVLDIRRNLAMNSQEENRDADVATTLTRLGNLYKNFTRYEEAEAKYKEALYIRHRLAEASPGRYDSDVATTLNNLAVLHSALNRHDDAEAEYKEALETYRRLAATSPDRYDADVADTLNNLAAHHLSLCNLKESENDFTEALSIYRHLAEKNPGRFNSNIEKIEKILPAFIILKKFPTVAKIINYISRKIRSIIIKVKNVMKSKQ